MGEAPGTPGGDGVTRDISLNGTGGDVVEAAPAGSVKCHTAPMN